MCNDVDGFGQVVSVSGIRHSIGSIPSTVGGSVESDAAAEFEVFYRANVRGVTAFFARRCSEPQLVADLTSEVFLQALASLDSYDLIGEAPDAGCSASCGWSGRSTASERPGVVRRSLRWRPTVSWVTMRSRTLR